MHSGLKPEESPRRVLVVDDDVSTLHTVEGILESRGFHTVGVHSIEAARIALTDRSFDLLVTDLYLSDDALGYELAEFARDHLPDLPVLLLTGRPTVGGVVEALRSSVREVLMKPVQPERLATVCHRVIDTARVERQARVHSAQNKVLCALVPQFIEAKDPTTSGHAQRVVRYADRLATHCGVSDEDREQLRLAALLHDIGKIAVPRSILTKEGPLTREERAVIEEHPRKGYDMLAGLEGCDKARDWVHQHHERWDGKGYPNGLKGDQVELPGRILILAEVYDALAEERSYKPRWPNEKIVDLFRREAGHHFCPDVAHIVADGLEAHGSRFFNPDPELLF